MLKYPEPIQIPQGDRSGKHRGEQSKSRSQRGGEIHGSKAINTAESA